MQKRKHPRLKQYDYSQPGVYFITFCTKNRELLLSGITQPDSYAPAVTRLTDIGRIVEGELRELPIGISLDKWVIMPNHVHLLVTIEQTSEAKTELSQFVRKVKSKSSHAAGRPLWQSSFYEHVVRGEKDYLEIWDYIDQNPAKWIEDEYYSEESSMKTVTLYTDGACSGNPGPGGWAAILMFGRFKKELSGGERDTTNNRMELTGVIEGLKALKEPCIVELYSDSKYVIDALEKSWAVGWRKRGWVKSDKKPALNSDLWGELLDLCEKHTVNLHWVKGHASNPYNNRCDELAVAQWQRLKG